MKQAKKSTNKSNNNEIDELAKRALDINRRMAEAAPFEDIPEFKPPPAEWPFLKELVEQTDILIEQNEIFNKLLQNQIEQTKNLVTENKRLGYLTIILIFVTILLVIIAGFQIYLLYNPA